MPPGENPHQRGAPSGGIAALVVAGIAVACCAALPLLIALAGGVAVATILGIGAGLAAAALLGAWLVARIRR
jgi:hypothetical protein